MPRKNNPKDFIGKEKTNTNGSIMKIIEYNNVHNIIVLFTEYNWTTKTEIKHFNSGKVKCPYDKSLAGIGYLGEGQYKVWDSTNNKMTPQYKKWSSMITRCYNTNNLKKKPCYSECYVCEEWHNYQNFAQWYDENYYEVPGEVMHLDKDILIKGNKEYGPDTCCFVPAKINCCWVNEYKEDDLPPGVKRRKDYKTFKYTSCLGITNKGESKRIYLPTVNSPEEAFYNYKEAKEHYVKQIADEYIDYLPPHVYEALYNWTIDISD